MVSNRGQLALALLALVASSAITVWAQSEAPQAPQTTAPPPATTTTNAQAPAPAPAPATVPTNKVKLGVYMESLCPDTRRFILNQLVPTEHRIGQAIDLRLVPFGHARTLGNNKMVCQHGARECEGNRRMACLLARSRNQTALVDTFGCLFSLQDDTRTCVAKHMAHVNFDELEKCTSGDESYQLMVKAEQVTGKLGYVPHLTVDEQWSEEIQDGAEHRLTEYLCKQYKGSEPLEGCKSPPAGTDAAHSVAQW